VFGDFHLHSNHSDGRLDPATLVDLVADAGVQIAALTDHDTTAGHVAAAQRSRERGLHFVPGIEMTTFGCGRVIHVLGLNVDGSLAQLEAANATALEVWDANQRRWIDALSQEGVDISFERDFADHPVRLPILIQRLCRNDVEAGDPLRVHALFRTFFDHLPEDAYAQLPTPALAAAIIREAGGIALLAHPEPLRESGLIVELLDSFDGLEAIYMPYSDAQQETLRLLAAQHGKLYSCGSDYHGYFTAGYRRPTTEAPADLLRRLGL
jgi:predicted metal-dependent phosphoesterase TrpH